MKMRAFRLLACVLAVAALATCGRSPTLVPSPAPAATATMVPPSPAPGAARSGERVAAPTTDEVESTAPASDTSSVASFVTPIDTWVRPADGMVMVYVPGGTFPMGSTGEDPDAVPDELPQHSVTLDSFWIDQTEVNNDQFTRFLNEHGNNGAQGVRMIVLDRGYSRISQAGDQFVITRASLDWPVLMVTWHGAAAYCEWAGGRLPTEAEWEYAARGPEGHLYPWGDAPPTCDLANYGDCGRVAAQVGSRPAGASWCGALDMAGNVWEWVADWFGPYWDRPQIGPTGPITGDVPVLRGGGWHSPRKEIRAAYRQHEIPSTGFNG